MFFFPASSTRLFSSQIFFLRGCAGIRANRGVFNPAATLPPLISLIFDDFTRGRWGGFDGGRRLPASSFFFVAAGVWTRTPRRSYRQALPPPSAEKRVTIGPWPPLPLIAAPGAPPPHCDALCVLDLLPVASFHRLLGVHGHGIPRLPTRQWGF